MIYNTQSRDDVRFRVLPGGVGRGSLAYQLPDGSVPYAQSAEGYMITDNVGRSLIDVSNNMTVNLHGHAHPQILEAMRSQIDQGLLSLGLPNEMELLHAERLLDRLPWATKVRYANSGTEAVMLAVRIARASTGREGVVLFDPSYHGSADVVLPAMGSYGSRGVPSGTLSASHMVAPRDLEALEQVFAQRGSEIAALLIDVCSGRAGMLPLSQEYVTRARELATKHGALLIVDEVVTFRNAFGGQIDTYGVDPDLMTLGKTIGGGLPIGAVVGTDLSMQVLDASAEVHIEHGGTFTANPATMAAGVAALELFDEREVMRLNELGELLEHAVAPHVNEYGWSFRRNGSVFRLWPDRVDASERGRVMGNLYAALYSQGILSSGSGLSCLSTVMTESVIEQIAEGFVRAAQESPVS